MKKHDRITVAELRELLADPKIQDYPVLVRRDAPEDPVYSFLSYVEGRDRSDPDDARVCQPVELKDAFGWPSGFYEVAVPVHFKTRAAKGEIPCIILGGEELLRSW